MSLYTYVSNKGVGNTSTLIKFSTGKDMVFGETVDLTAQEIQEATVKLANFVNVQAGTIAVNINSITLPPVRYYTRIGTVATSKKPYQK